MADTVTTSTKKLTREQIAAIVGNNPRAIRMFELLVADVAETLPQAIDEVLLSGLFSLHGADGSKQAAQTALHGLIEQQTLLQACQRATSQAAMLRAEVDLLRLELHDLRAHLSTAIQQAQKAAADALTLASGV